MNETDAIIERITQVNSGYQHLELAVDPSLLKGKPGQSILVRTNTGSWDPYLRDQWWPVDIVEGKMQIERPITERYEAGQVVNIIGLVGQPFRFRRTLRNVLLLAYATPPTPLLMIIPWLLGNNISVTLALVGTAAHYETEHLDPEVEIIHGDDDLSWPNQVMTIGWADQVFVVVGQDDENRRFDAVKARFEELRADLPKNYLWGVFQPPIPCGVGACYACMLQMIKGTSLICTEGPAFDLLQVSK